MRKLVALLLLLAVTIALSGHIDAERFGEKSFAVYCPADTVAYCELPDFDASLKQGPNLLLYELINSEDGRAELGSSRNILSKIVFFRTFLELYTSAIKKRGNNCGSISFVVPYKYDGDPVSLAAFDVTNPSSFILGFNNYSPFFRKFVKELDPDHEAKISFSKTEISGRKGLLAVNSVDMDESLRPVLFEYRNFLVFCTHKRYAERFVSEADAADRTSLIENPDFVKCTDRIGGDELKCYVDLPTVTEMLTEEDCEFPELLSTCFERAGFGLSFDGRNIVSEFSLIAMQTLRPAFAETGNRSVNLNCLKYLKSDVLIAGDFSLPPCKVLDDAFSQFESYKTYDDMLKQKIGKSMVMNILPALGKEMAVCLRCELIPQLLAVIELENPDVIVEILDAMSLVADFEITRTEYLDTYLYNTNHMPSPLKTAFAVKDGKLFYGTKSLLLTALNLDENQSIANSEFLKDSIAATIESKANGLIFANTAKLAAILNPSFSLMVDLDKAWIAKALADSDPVVITLKANDDGLTYASKGPVELAVYASLELYSLYKTLIKTSNRHRSDFVRATLKAFGSAALDFSKDNPNHNFWENDTTDFSPFFAHEAVKGEFEFRYFSNDLDTDKDHRATRFLYLAYPSVFGPGKNAYWIDESQMIFEAKDVTDEQIARLRKATPDFSDKTIAGTVDVLPVEGVIWKKR